MSLTVNVAEGVFHFKGTRADGSAKWHFVANPDQERKAPPRRFMSLMYRKDKKKRGDQS